MGRFLRVVKYLRKKRLVMHWIGSDVLTARAGWQAGLRAPRLIQEAVHWAETPWITEEVRALGISCETMPLPGARLAERPVPLGEQFSVLVYVPGTQRYAYYGAEATPVSDFYGLDQILEAARALPKIPFHMVGLAPNDVPDCPQNLHLHGQVENLQTHFELATVLWRPVAHDGLSFMVLEALAQGRHVIWSYSFPACRQAVNASEATAHLRELHRLHQSRELEINWEGVRLIDASYRGSDVRARIIRRLQAILDT